MRVTMSGEMEIIGRQAKTCEKCGSNIWAIGEAKVTPIEPGEEMVYASDEYLETRICFVCTLKVYLAQQGEHPEVLATLFKFIKDGAPELWRMIKEERDREPQYIQMYLGEFVDDNENRQCDAWRGKNPL
jgi:hypothetical protein